MKKYLVLADDFTGAQEVAGKLKQKHITTGVALSVERVEGLFVQHQVVVLNTNSRLMSEDELRECYQRIFHTLDTSRYGIAKKIDSLLRGPIGLELAQIKAYLPKTKFIVSVPVLAEGRTVVNGEVLIKGVRLTDSDLAHDPLNPILTSSIAEKIGLNSALTVTSIPKSEDANKLYTSIAEQLKTHDVVAVDAESQDDLNAVPAFLPDTVLVGSSDFISLVGAIAGKWLFVVGSLHPRSRQQADYLIRTLGAVDISVDVASWLNDPVHYLDRLVATALESAESQQYFVIRTRLPETDVITISDSRNAAYCLADMAQRIASALPVLQIVCCGGETTAALLHRGGAQAVTMEHASEKAMPLGRVEGGIFHRAYIASKPGSFGEPELFVRMVNHATA